MTPGPRKPKSRPAEGVQRNIEQNQYQISFDIDRFDEVLDSQGINLIHYRSFGDPRGMTSRGDNRDAYNIKPKTSDGFIYRKSGTLRGFFSNNSASSSENDVGSTDSASAYLTLPRTYSDSDELVLVHPWDKFYLADIETKVVTTQFQEARESGIDRLHFPVVRVIDIMDAKGAEYKQDVDFTVTAEGWIKWISQNQPGFDHKVGRGTVYSIRYEYTPYFVVDRLLHEIRVANHTDLATYERSVKRMPYQALIMREFLFLERFEDPRDQSSSRTRIQPQEGSGKGGPVGKPTLGDKPTLT